MTPVWDPGQYALYAAERARPFGELLSRVRHLDPALDPAYVVDLGCGPGDLTASLAEWWPQARVDGVDASAQMVATARRRYANVAGLHVDHADLREWTPQGPIDLLISNATLQWVPSHLAWLPRLVERVRPGAWFAFGVPGNFDAPSHRILDELAAEEPWAGHLADARAKAPHAYDAERYLAELVALGCWVDAWETTYLHVVEGPDPVFDWIKGTGARPLLQALPDDLRERFEEAYKQRLRAAYPPRSFGTVLPFRRVFVVAQTPGATA